MKEKTVPCRWCRTPTRMLGTRQCDRCWELSHRIEHDPQLAMVMLASMDGVKIGWFRRLLLVRMLREQNKRLREALKMASERLDILTNWIEHTYVPDPLREMQDIKSGRAYAEAARKEATLPLV